MRYTFVYVQEKHFFTSKTEHSRTVLKFKNNMCIFWASLYKMCIIKKSRQNSENEDDFLYKFRPNLPLNQSRTRQEP